MRFVGWERSPRRTLKKLGEGAELLFRRYESDYWGVGHVRKLGCGVVVDDFAPATLARALNRLTCADSDRMKAGFDRAARVHNAENNAVKLRQVVASVLKEL